MKILFSALTIVVALLPSLRAAQAPAAVPPGPTMEETKTWLESEGRALMRARGIQQDRPRLRVSTGEEHVDTLTLTDCRLTWHALRTIETITVTARGSVTTGAANWTDVRLDLQDLNPSSSGVQPETLFTDAPIYAVRLVIRDPRTATSTASIDNGNPQVLPAVIVRAQTAEDGQRIANAIKRAAVLCGATTGGTVF